jgi:hypothetical protein
MERRSPAVTVALVAVVLVVVVGVGYAVSALSRTGGTSSPRSQQVVLPSATDHAGPAVRSSPTAQATPKVHLLETYYLGPGPRGPVLHQTTSIAPPVGGLSLSLDMLEVQPDDHHYHSWWQPGWLQTVRHTHGLISVDLGDAPEGRPPAMDAPTATASVQQIVYTLQAVTHSHDPVRFTRNDNPATAVLGIPVTRPVQARPPALVVSRMNVLEPEPDGVDKGRKPYTVSGTGSTAQGLVTVRVEQHGRVLQTKTTRMPGSGDPNRLYSWKVVIDIRGYAKGTYQVTATGADPTDPSLTVSDEQPLHLG